MYLQFTDVGKGNPNVVQLRVWIWPFLIQNPIFLKTVNCTKQDFFSIHEIVSRLKYHKIKPSSCLKFIFFVLKIEK